MAPPDLSILVLGRNGRELTRDCLQSVKDHAGGLALETIYLDNGSEDGSVELVRREFPGTLAIEMGRNAGFARACNVGIARMTGRHGLLLNNDATVTAGALATAVAWMDAHPETGILGANLLSPDGSRQNAVHPIPGLLSELVPLGLLRRLFPGRYPGRRVAYEAPAEVPAVLGAFVLFSRELLARVGPLDERYFFYLEETEWCHRARRAGLRVVHHPDVRVYHQHGKTASRSRVANRIEFARSKYRFFRQVYGWPAALALSQITVTKLVLQAAGTTIAVLATLGLAAGPRRKWRQYGWLLAWHLAGLPSGWGLETGYPDRPVAPLPRAPEERQEAEQPGRAAS